MAKCDPWRLDLADVQWGFYGSATSERRKRRLSRELDTRSMDLKLTHVPSGIEVIGTIAPGHYSRKAMQTQRDKLYRELFADLEEKVARHLRLAGR